MTTTIIPNNSELEGFQKRVLLAIDGLLLIEKELAQVLPSSVGAVSGGVAWSVLFSPRFQYYTLLYSSRVRQILETRERFKEGQRKIGHSEIKLEDSLGIVLKKRAQALNILKNPALNPVLCTALRRLTEEASSYAKGIAGGLVALCATGSVEIPLDHIVIAAIAIEISKHGIGHFCD